MSTPENDPTPIGGGGGGGGTVDQGTAGATSWKVVEDNSAAIKTAIESIDTKMPADPATDTSVQAVTQAIVDLGDGTTIDQVATAINTVNTTLGTPLQEGGNVVASGTVAISGLVAVTGPLTDVQLRASPVPVSGTVTANLGTLNGAATVAKQPALGTAGTPSADVITVQGVAGGTALPSSNAASSQVDGHSATIGATTDADSTNTLVGRLKKLVSLLAGGLPAALGSNGGLKTEPASQAASAYTYVRVTTDGANSWPVTTLGSGISAPSNPMAVAAWVTGRAYSGVSSPGLGHAFRTDTFGRMYATVMPNLTADGTTDAKTRWPTGGDLSASSSGVIVLKTTGGRIYMIDVYYTGSTASNLWLQLHNAASATTPTTATLRKSWPMNNGANIQIEWESELGFELSAGIKLVASSKRITTTIATTETFSAFGEGA